MKIPARRAASTLTRSVRSPVLAEPAQQHAVEQLKSWLGDGAQQTILEVGSSSGFLLAELLKGMPRALLIGSDCIRQPLTRLTERLPGVSLVHFDATSCPLSRGSVGAAVLLNVIEHISRDDFAVAELHRILKPGGIAVVEVPAGPHLYDFYDAHLRHCRRYRIRDLRQLFEANGFEILHESHLGFFLYPAFWAVKKFNRRFRGVTTRPRETLVREAIRTSETGGRIPAMLLRLEAVLRRKIYLPFGIRCVITCRKCAGSARTGERTLRVSVDAALRAGIFKASGSFDPMGWSVGARRSFPRP